MDVCDKNLAYEKYRNQKSEIRMLRSCIKSVRLLRFVFRQGMVLDDPERLAIRRSQKTKIRMLRSCIKSVRLLRFVFRQGMVLDNPEKRMNGCMERILGIVEL